MKTTYFIFGERICRIFEEQGFKAALKIADKHGDYTITSFNPQKDSPVTLLSIAEGWGGFRKITEKQFQKFLSLK